MKVRNLQLDLIHYGSARFCKTHFNPIEMQLSFPIKPKGGLWTSPVDSEYGWFEWSIDNEFHEDSLEEWFRLAYSGKTVVISCAADLDELPLALVPGSISPLPRILFEQLVEQGVDAIWLTTNGEQETRFRERPHQVNLYGWDCETVLVMNPRTVRQTDSSSSGKPSPGLEKQIDAS